MVFAQVTINKLTFKIDEFLKRRLDIIKRLIQNKWDCLFLIDGMERSGKSTLGITCAWYLSNGKISKRNFAQGCDDAIEKIDKLPDRSVIIIDEGSMLFDSKDALRKELKKLVKVLNVCGQKEMVIIVILPSFFELIPQIACRRSRFLLHVYTDKHYNRGRFLYFSEQKKRILYVEGKKKYGSYKYPTSTFRGLFKDFNPFEEEYLKIKKVALKEAFKDDYSRGVNPVKFKKVILLDVLSRLLELKEIKSLKQEQLSKLIGCSLATLKTYLKIIKRRKEFTKKSLSS